MSDPAAAQYLAGLGARVRNRRAARGMTRRGLAEASGVSERYLAELESGRGNISVLLLRQVAAAMGVPLDELARDRPEPSVEARLTLELMAGLPEADQRALHQLVRERFGAGRTKGRRVALIGLRGAGKTTLGGTLAARHALPFIRLDGEIERLAGLSIGEIFSLSGQAAYRRLEYRALAQAVADHEAAVIEAGGSLVTEPATFNFLLERCFVVWVRARPDEHMARVIAQGDLRPMADNREAMADLELILAERESFYAKADATLDTAGREIAACLSELDEICQAVLARS